MLAVHYGRPCDDFLAPTSPSKRVCPTCSQTIGKESYVCTKENLTLHTRCFVCSCCRRSLTTRSYGMDLNGKFYCKDHMISARPSESDYKTLASGWLFKQGAVVKKWRRRFFVLTIDSCELRYYKSSSLQQQKGVIDLSTVSSIQPAYLFVPPDRNHREWTSGSLPSLQLITHNRIWNLACETDSVREYWADAIRTAQATSSASAAASSGVGRSSRNRSSHTPSLVASPSPPPFSLAGISSPPRVPLSQPQSSPRSNNGNTSVPVPAPSLLANSARDTDDAETSSPDDDCSSTTQDSHSCSGSTMGSCDGSAQSTQSFCSPNASGVEGGVGARRVITVQPLVVPSSTILLSGGAGTPTLAGTAAFGSPNKKFPCCAAPSSGIVSPLPCTPSGYISPGDGGFSSGGDSSSTSSQDYSYQMDESRLRASSAGASFIQMYARVSTTTNSHLNASPKPLVVSSKVTVKQNTGIVSPSNDSFLCSPIKTPSDVVPSLVFVSNGN